MWVPKIYNRPLYSEILDKWFTIPVTMRAMEMIDEAFGLDNYILGVIFVPYSSKSLSIKLLIFSYPSFFTYVLVVLDVLAILLLPLIQEGLLSVRSESMCTKYWLNA